MPEGEESKGKTWQQEQTEQKLLLATRWGQEVGAVLKRLDEMTTDDYIEAVRAHFGRPEVIEPFMDVLLTFKEEERKAKEGHPTMANTRYGALKLEFEPGKSEVFKKTFAKFLVMEPKIMLGQINKDIISLMAYVTALQQYVRKERKITSFADLFG